MLGRGSSTPSLAAAAVAMTVLIGTCAVTAASAGASRAVLAHQAYAPRCSDSRYSPLRDPSNPLELLVPPGADPLRGANFFVDGPAHGAAAGAIAKLLGFDPKSYPDDYPWTQFQEQVVTPALTNGRVSQQVAHQVQMLEKIASQPEAQRFSLYSGGGGPGAIFGQVQKILCKNLTADPGTIPVFTTFFLYQAGYCESLGQILGNRDTFERQVDEMAQGIGRHPAVALLELDSVATSKCTKGRGALAAWEHDIRYEINAISALPHTVVYVEGGYSDADSPRYTAKVLNAVGVRHIRGFFTNDTHENWTRAEVKWAQKVSHLTHAAHFIVNTAQNGQGPLRPRNRVRNGNEVLCNPPGRGLGPRGTTQTGFPGADAFMWTAVPGNSSGTCNGGPSAGTFWPANAIGKAERANGRLGPGYRSEPY